MYWAKKILVSRTYHFPHYYYCTVLYYAVLLLSLLYVDTIALY